jgi:SAM-dependent methyltransferase
VSEYVDDSNALLSQLNYLLAPGGYILIGTPNAANIDLTRPDVSNHYNPIYAPYHLHFYTAKPLESLASRQERKAVEFFDRLYYDLPFVLNTPAWNKYQHLLDGTLNVVLEPIKTWKA